jgi:hypothetical protein
LWNHRLSGEVGYLHHEVEVVGNQPGVCIGAEGDAGETWRSLVPHVKNNGWLRRLWNHRLSGEVGYLHHEVEVVGNQPGVCIGAEGDAGETRTLNGPRGDFSQLARVEEQRPGGAKLFGHRVREGEDVLDSRRSPGHLG